jgi:hypothetical protein
MTSLFSKLDPHEEQRREIVRRREERWRIAEVELCWLADESKRKE